MNSGFLNEKLTPILMIILGIISLLFPMVSTQTIGIMSGIAFMLLSIGFIINGISEIMMTRYFGLIRVIYGIICAIFAYYLMFNPAFVSGFIGLSTYIFGILLIILGLISLFMGPIAILGIVTVIYGFLTVILAYMINDPKILGSVIGVWLLISGILSLFTKKDYIDV